MNTVDNATLTPRLGGHESSIDRRYELFAALWAVASIAHLLNVEAQGLSHPTGWLTLVAAVAVLHKPSSAGRLGAFAVIQVIETIAIAPYVADHQLLMAAVNLALAIHLGHRYLATRSGADLRLPATVSSSARLLLLLAYTGAAVAKYNTTFLEPATSCATFFLEYGTFGWFDPEGELGWLPVLGTIGSETLIAITLLIPRTRRYGLRYGILFHLLVSASPLISVEDFTLTLDALFIFFMTDRDIDRLMSSARKIRRGSSLATNANRISSNVRVVGVSVALFAIGFWAPGFPARAMWPLGLITGLWLLANLARTLQRDSIEPVLRRPTRGAAASLILIVLAVASPYLGIRTLGVFTMFSNLRTGGAGTNHLFLPSLDLYSKQGDYLVPSDESSEHFRAIIDDGQSIHLLEIRREVADGAATVVAIGARDGLDFDSRDAVDSPLTWFERKVLYFRGIPADGPPLCRN